MTISYTIECSPEQKIIQKLLSMLNVEKDKQSEISKQYAKALLNNESIIKHLLALKECAFRIDTLNSILKAITN